MKYKIKVVGNGIMVRGILFSPDRYDGLYVVDKEFGDYLINTFPKEFVLIEKIKDTAKNPKKELLRKERETTSELHTKSKTRRRTEVKRETTSELHIKNQTKRRKTESKKENS